MTLGRPLRFLLVYSSQTGQAQAIAEEVAEKAPSHGLEADMHCISNTEKKFWLERERCLVFITSTTGDGEPPETALKFWRRIRKKTLPSDHLAHLNYALLGLGDTNYTNFCKCGKSFNKRFEELGAKKILPAHFADDAEGLETVVEPWMELLFPALHEHLSTHGDGTSTAHDDVSRSASVHNGTTEPANQGAANTNLTPTTGNKVSNQALTVDKTTGERTQKPEIGNADEKTDVLRTDQPKTDESKSDKPSTDSVSSDSVDSVDSSVETLTHSVSPLRESSLSLPVLPPRYLSIQYDPDLKLEPTDDVIHNGYPFPSSQSGIQRVPVVAAEVLTRQDAVKKTIELTLDIADTGMEYKPGDAFGFVCKNDPEEIQELIDRLGVSDTADTPCHLSVLADTKKRSAAVPAHLSPEGTVRGWLSDCDLRAPLKKTLVRALIPHTPDARHQRRLQELVSREGAGSYQALVRGAGLGVRDVLEGFTSCRPPVELLLEQLPRLAARPYSAASCQSVRPDRVDFVFNVVEIPAESGRSTDRRGVCTGWLDRLTSQLQTTRDDTSDSDISQQLEGLQLKETRPTIPVFLRSNQHFRPPADLTTPLIMIGPGTGVAPFIGFLQHRASELASVTDQSSAGESWLFYGCRHKDRDYLYRRELGEFHSQGVLSQLSVCFSRDNRSPDNDDDNDDNNSAPRYVQDSMRCHGDRVVTMVTEKKAEIYVCGDAKNMAKDVRAMFVELLEEHKGFTKKEAEQYLVDLVIKKRYHEDLWA